MKYLSLNYAIITLLPHKNQAKEQCLAGSFTGEVGSYNATEPPNGWLVMDGNHDISAMA